MKLKVNHGNESYDFEQGVVPVLYLFVFFNSKFIQEVIKYKFRYSILIVSNIHLFIEKHFYFSKFVTNK